MHENSYTSGFLPFEKAFLCVGCSHIRLHKGFINMKMILWFSTVTHDTVTSCYKSITFLPFYCLSMIWFGRLCFVQSWRGVIEFIFPFFLFFRKTIKKEGEERLIHPTNMEKSKGFRSWLLRGRHSGPRSSRSTATNICPLQGLNRARSISPRDQFWPVTLLGSISPRDQFRHVTLLKSIWFPVKFLLLRFIVCSMSDRSSLRVINFNGRLRACFQLIQSQADPELSCRTVHTFLFCID